MPRKLDAEFITAAIAGFEEQKKRLNSQIAELRQLLSGPPSDGAAPGPTKRRTMSAAARARIAAAQRKRWTEARQKTAEEVPAPARKKRKLSAAGRKRMIEATKRRWAATRAASKS